MLYMWLWLALEWYTDQSTLNTPFKLDVILDVFQQYDTAQFKLD